MHVSSCRLYDYRFGKMFSMFVIESVRNLKGGNRTGAFSRYRYIIAEEANGYMAHGSLVDFGVNAATTTALIATDMVTRVS